jgi:hypothetical protein
MIYIVFGSMGLAAIGLCLSSALALCKLINLARQRRTRTSYQVKQLALSRFSSVDFIASEVLRGRILQQIVADTFDFHVSGRASWRKPESHYTRTWTSSVSTTAAVSHGSQAVYKDSC